MLDGNVLLRQKRDEVPQVVKEGKALNNVS